MTEQPNQDDSFSYGAQLDLLNDIADLLKLAPAKVTIDFFLAPFWHFKGFDDYNPDKAGRFLLKLCTESDRKKTQSVFGNLRIPCSTEDGTAEEKYFGIVISANDMHLVTPELARYAETIVHQTELLAGLNKTARIGHLSGIDPEHSTPRWKLNHSTQSGSSAYALLEAYDDYALKAYSGLLSRSEIGHNYLLTQHGLAELHLSHDEFHRLTLDKIHLVVDLQNRTAEQPNTVQTLTEIAPRNWAYGFRPSQLRA